MLRRIAFSLIGGATLVWSLVFVALALGAPHGLSFFAVMTTTRFRVSTAILDALLWPSFLFTRWRVPDAEAINGPAVPYAFPLWFFDVPLAALLLFGLLSLRAARARATTKHPAAA